MPIYDSEKRREYDREWYQKHKEKIAARKLKYYHKNKERISESRKTRQYNRTSNYKIRYKLDKEKLAEFFNSRNNKCEICGTTEKRLCVDHNSKCCPSGPNTKTCGKCLRGLLCHLCNSMLGSAKDNTETLSNAIKYLERTGNKESVT
jgi:hypothetical protein